MGEEERAFPYSHCSSQCSSSQKSLSIPNCSSAFKNKNVSDRRIFCTHKMNARHKNSAVSSQSSSVLLTHHSSPLGLLLGSLWGWPKPPSQMVHQTGTMYQQQHSLCCVPPCADPCSLVKFLEAAMTIYAPYRTTFKNSLHTIFQNIKLKTQEQFLCSTSKGPVRGICCSFALNPTDGEQDTCRRRHAENQVVTQSVVNLPSLGFPSSLSPGSGSYTSFLPGTKGGPTAASWAHLLQRKGVHCARSPISSC